MSAAENDAAPIVVVRRPRKKRTERPRKEDSEDETPSEKRREYTAARVLGCCYPEDKMLKGHAFLYCKACTPMWKVCDLGKEGKMCPCNGQGRLAKTTRKGYYAHQILGMHRSHSMKRQYPYFGNIERAMKGEGRKKQKAAELEEEEEEFSIPQGSFSKE